MAPIRYSVKAAPVYARTSPSALYGSSVTPPPRAPLASTGVALGTAARLPGTPPAAGGAGYGSGLGKAFSGIGQALGQGVTRAGGAINGRPLVRTQATPDPFAALSDDQQQARAQSMIDALINPRLAEIRAEYDRRSAQGSAAIKGITDALASRLAGFGASARDIYSQAQQSTAATEAALAGYLQGQGGAQAAGLASQLAGINAPAATGAATAAVQQAGTGAAGASYGKGSAVLEDLIQRGASAQEYAAKLPGIGAALGLQQLGRFQGQLTEDEKTALGQLTSQVPGLVSSTLSDLRSTELSKAQERERIREYGQTRADRLAANKAANAARVTAATLAANAKTTAATTAAGAKATAAQAKEDALRNRPSPSLTTQHSRFLVNAYGETLTRNGKPIANPGYVPPRDASGTVDHQLEPDLDLTKANGSAYVLNGYGQVYTTPGGHTLKYAPPATGSGGSSFHATSTSAQYLVDPKTGETKPNPNYVAPADKPVSASEWNTEVGQLAATPGAMNWQTRTPSKPLWDMIRQRSIDIGQGDPGKTPRAFTKDELDVFRKQFGLTQPAAGTSAADKAKAKAEKAAAAAQKARAGAVKERGNALDDATHRAYSEATKLLGKPVRNPQPDSYRNPGVYLDPQGKGTNDANAALHEGHASWGEAYARVYARIGGDRLAARYGLTQKEIRDLITKQLVSLGFRPPRQPAKPKATRPTARRPVATTPAAPEQDNSPFGRFSRGEGPLGAFAR